MPQDEKDLGEILELDEDRLYFFHAEEILDELGPSDNVIFNQDKDDFGTLRARAIRKHQYSR